MGEPEGLEKTCSLKKTKEEWIEEFMKGWGPALATMFQHTASGFLCIPSILSLGDDPSYVSSLAVLGILCEMGWEIQHTIIDMFYVRLFTKDGKTKMPNALIFGLLVHHSVTCLMGIPTIRRYRELKHVHWLCFNLAGGPGLMQPFTEYSKLLDVSKPHDLRHFKICNIISLLIWSWTRLFHYFYCIAQLLLVFYHDKAWSFITIGTPLLLLMFLFINLPTLISLFKRVKKFHKASAEYEALPNDVSKDLSMRNLEDSARDLLDEAENIDLTISLVKLLAKFEDRKVDMRQTMPPRTIPAWGSMRTSLLLSRSMPPRTRKEE